MTLTEFIAEIETDLSSFAESNDIDRVSIKGWVITCLRKMGNNITDIRETIVDVRNSRAVLPETFKTLKLALKLTQDSYRITGDGDRVKESYIYRQRVENEAWFNEITREYETNCNSKIITEKVLIGGDNIEFYYNPEWLSLTKGIKKDVLSTDCLNISPAIRNAFPHEINITGRTLNANFPEGKIYIQYNSLPTEEDGDLIIPEFSTSDLVDYIKVFVKVQIAENLIANNKNPQGLGQLYSMWQQQLPFLKRAALTETSFAGLGKNWVHNLKGKNERLISIFNLPKF